MRDWMSFDLRHWTVRLLPQGPMDLARQLLLIGVSLVAYEHVRTLTASDAGVAFGHARELISLERSLHIFVEPSVQAWAGGSRLLIDTADWLYLNAQTSIVIGALIYLYRFRNASFYFVRNTLIISWGIALIGYFVFPTAPPRLLPEWGFVDTVANFTHVHEQTSTVISLINPYAAVPSMHVALAIIIGWPMARLVRSRIARMLWLAYPPTIAFVTVVTANHLLSDALLGTVVAGLSAYGAQWLARARPDAWRLAGTPA
jgi:membrane-associated phospholipid phosphatase